MAQRDDVFEVYVDDSPEPALTTQRLLIIVLSAGCLALAVSNVFLATRVTQLRRALVAERSASVPSTAEQESAPAGAGPRAAEPSSTTARESAPPAAVERPAVSTETERRAVTQALTPEPSTTPERLTPAEQTSAPERTSAAERTTAAERPIAEPAAPAASVASPVSPPAAPKLAPVPAAQAPTPKRAEPELPPRPGPREQERVATVTREQDRVAAVTRGPDRTVAAPSSQERATAAWMVQAYGRPEAERRARAVADFYGTHSPDGSYWRRVLTEITRR